MIRDSTRTMCVSWEGGGGGVRPPHPLNAACGRSNTKCTPSVTAQPTQDFTQAVTHIHAPTTP